MYTQMMREIRDSDLLNILCDIYDLHCILYEVRREAEIGVLEHYVHAITMCKIIMRRIDITHSAWT